MQNYLAKEHNAVSDIIPSNTERKAFTTPMGNSLGDINQIHQQLKSLVGRSHGISTKHLQGYLDWLCYKKYLKYTYEREDQAKAVYDDLLNTYAHFRCEEFHKAEQPISLYEAYGEYHYGIFAV